MTPRILALVFLGGALGAMARVGLALWLLAVLPGVWPWGTLVANVAGSLLIGVFAGLRKGGVRRGGVELDHFVMTGLLGGFTTFSLFSLEALTLWQAALPALALAYVTISLLLWLPAVALGYAVGQRLGRGGAL
ncbi:fluoride efflux transporter FluC [Isoalcanivorax indicus]|uniref:fluoride efflux transporter FluC n=1 Tax=Isoalcanivorax indicus TaxID=2202653 RepID=UPI000DB91335|nr:CrcB family protein [Isoalcanivorax indicus]